MTYDLASWLVDNMATVYFGEVAQEYLHRYDKMFSMRVPNRAGGTTDVTALRGVWARLDMSHLAHCVPGDRDYAALFEFGLSGLRRVIDQKRGLPGPPTAIEPDRVTIDAGAARWLVENGASVRFNANAPPRDDPEFRPSGAAQILVRSRHGQCVGAVIVRSSAGPDDADLAMRLCGCINDTVSRFNQTTAPGVASGEGSGPGGSA